MDEVFWRKTTTGSTSQTEFLLTDALGSTWGLADQSGSVNTLYKYDIFGTTQATGQSSATNNPLQYTGRENDETGLYYYRNRYYSPDLRRFISRDPLREGAGENEYAYVGGNPVSLTDPLGLQSGPVNYLRDPFSPDRWVLNGLSNTINDTVSLVVDLDGIAQSAWTLGNWCAPLSDRLWAGAHLGFEIASAVLPAGKALKGAGGAIFKRIPCNPFTAKWLAKACFVKGTLIHTKEGFVPIEEIKSGDEVLSYNEKTKQTEYKSVIETYIRQTEQIVKLNIEGEEKTIETTPEHPFFVRIHKARDSLLSDDDGEWKEAGNLQVGDEVLLANGQWRNVESLEQQAINEQVYNFAVEDNHNYFVGQNGTLVHNTYPTKLLGKGTETAKHHIIPAFRGANSSYYRWWLANRLDVDLYTVVVAHGKRSEHLWLIHGKGKYNQIWKNWIDANPSATVEDVYRFAGAIMDQFGLSGRPIIPFR